MSTANKQMFVEHLFSIVSNERNKEIIHWRPEGGFTIEDSARLANEVLPEFFAHSQFSSFVRQLSNYHFVSLKDKRDSELGPYSFRHETDMFLPNRHDLVPLIKRRKDNRRLRRLKRKQEEMNRRLTVNDKAIEAVRDTNSADALRYAHGVIAQQTQRIADLKRVVAELERELDSCVAVPPVAAAAVSLENFVFQPFDFDLAGELNLLDLHSNASTSPSSSPVGIFDHGLLLDS